MKLLTATKTIGMTFKLVLEVDEAQAHALLEALPGDLTLNGQVLSDMQIGVDGLAIEPARIALEREDVSLADEDLFLENS